MRLLTARYTHGSKANCTDLLPVSAKCQDKTSHVLGLWGTLYLVVARHTIIDCKEFVFGLDLNNDVLCCKKWVYLARDLFVQLCEVTDWQSLKKIQSQQGIKCVSGWQC